MVSLKHIKKGAEIFVDYGMENDWDALKLAYLPDLLATIRLAAVHYGLVLDEGVVGSVMAVRDLVTACQGGSIHLLMAEFLDYRPVARADAALDVYDRIPAVLLTNEERVVVTPAGNTWLEQLLTARSFADAYGFCGHARVILSGTGEHTNLLPIRRKAKSCTGRVRAVPKSYSEDAIAVQQPECSDSWQSAYGLDQAEHSSVEGQGHLGSVGQEGMGEDVEVSGEEEVVEAELVIINLNVDGAAALVYEEVCQRIKSVRADIAVLVDTRVRFGLRTVESKVLTHLGSRYRVFTNVDTEGSATHAQRVGGIVYIVGPRVTDARLVRLCNFGAATSLEGSLGGAAFMVMGMYWPQSNKKDGTLWPRVTEYAGMDAVRYVKRLASQALETAREAGRKVFLVGDLNTDVDKRDKYNLVGFMEDNNLRHAGSDAMTGLPSFCSRGKLGTKVATRLDYQLVGDGDVTRCACIPVTHDTLHTGLHRVLVGRYWFPAGLVKKMHRLLPPWRPPEIKLNQTRKVARCQEMLEKLQIPRDSAVERLEKLITEIVRIVAKVCGKGTRQQPEGWSPATRSIFIMLDRVQAIRRHVQGSRRYTAWTPSTYRAGLAGVLRQWRADVRQLAEDGGSTMDPLNPSKSKHGYDSWVHCTWEQ